MSRAPLVPLSVAGPVPPGERALRNAKRQQILDAATRVFASRGYHGARVSDIAREAGIAYGLVYHYFRNKEEILDTIFAERWGAFLEVVEGIAAGPQPAAEKLRQFAAIVLFANRRRPDWVKVLVFEIQRTSRFSEPEQIEAVGRLFRSVARIVRLGQEAGELRQDLDANLVCLAFIGALETMITSQVLGVMRLPDAAQTSDDGTVRTVVDMFLSGLAVRSGS
jgi:TetR/AcrR family transcriptional regulator, fatty acid metabolism regulator protein